MGYERIYRRTAGDAVLDLFVYSFILLVVIITLYPLIYVFSMSISDPRAVITGQVILLPRGFSIQAYQKVLGNSLVYRYYYNTIWYTVVGTVCSVTATMLIAYPLSRRRFFARKALNIFVLITMFFNAGMIPTYVVVVKLGLYNSRWAIILPSLTAAWYIIIARTFLQQLPEELFENARLEGASEARILLSIVLPLSKPIIATLVMYFATNQWNSYFPAMIYLSNQDLHPMQIFLRRAVIQSQPEAMDGLDPKALGDSVLAMMQVKYAVVIVAVLPVLLLYPLLQKYFIKGILIGAIKG